MRKPHPKFDKDIIKKSKYQKFQDFHNLMRFRVRDILLVSSLYDSYIFEEDGRLYEQLRGEYQGLNLSHSPELRQVPSGKEALELAEKENRFNLVIVTLHIEDMSLFEFTRKIKVIKPDIPVILLGYDNREMSDLLSHKDISLFDKVFIWQGDFRIIFGIIKYIEDRQNIEEDTANVGVQVIILIEDNIRFYSSYLPIIYSTVVRQAQSLISEGINLSHKFLRMRARPKIILCSTYEEAWEYYKKYEEYVLGIISDIDFSRIGIQDPKAGLIFAENVKKEHPDIPIMLQSNNGANKEIALKLGTGFALKDSPTLLQELRKFMIDQFSFGDFIFRKPDGEEVARASSLKDLELKLKEVPEECIEYHASRNHFSNWLKARTEFWLAHKLRPRKITEYNSIEELRQMLILSINEFRRERLQGVISDFHKETFGSLGNFARIGNGSIGGKGRGLGFVNSLLSNFAINKKYPDANIFVPHSALLATDVFDRFLDDNNLRKFALECNDDSEILRKFIEAKKFPSEIREQLNELLDVMTEPLAIRSSSLLEDSQGQPFAGVYDTIMIPNNHPDKKMRFKRMCCAIKQIYASTFYRKSKEYIKVTSYRLEEEKMAVIIQKTVGAPHGNRFYPEISGVAKSYNFYPTPPLSAKDGIVSAALGLGKIIVEGGATIRFCPKFPHHLLQYATIDDTLKYSQKDFFSLDLAPDQKAKILTENEVVKKLPLEEADKDGVLSYIGSTYSEENHTIYDGTSRDGVRLFSLAPILKYRVFPLPEIIELLLEVGSWGMGSPVEIEFAVNLSVPKGHSKEFGLLQMRPLVINNEMEELEVEGHPIEKILCRSSNVLGNGIIEGIDEIVFVDINRFDRSKSREVAEDVAYFNSKIISRNKRYLLIGVGRWGTFDPWLGIPVKWEQISGVKTIIESNFKDFDVTPSQGTHFFQNLTSFKVGYFTVNSHLNHGSFIDWSWLENLPVNEKRGEVYHVSLEKPLSIIINGREGKGVILKPE